MAASSSSKENRGPLEHVHLCLCQIWSVASTPTWMDSPFDFDHNLASKSLHTKTDEFLAKTLSVHPFLGGDIGQNGEDIVLPHLWCIECCRATKTLPEIAVRVDGRFQCTMLMSWYHQMCGRTIFQRTSQNDKGQEHYLSKKRDIVTNPENPGVRVTNGHIDIDPVKNVSNRQVREGICPGAKVGGPPNVYSKAGA
jgi:hypothetical protein